MVLKSLATREEVKETDSFKDNEVKPGKLIAGEPSLVSQKVDNGVDLRCHISNDLFPSLTHIAGEYG